MKKFTPFMLAALTVLAACKKSSLTPDQNNNGGNNITKIAPDGFNFSTTKSIGVSLSLKAPNGDALKGVIVSLYNPANTNQDAAIYKGVTDNNGNLVTTVSIPSELKQLIIDPAYVGLMRYAKANISGTSISASIGGSNGFGGDIIPQEIVVQSGSTPGVTLLSTGSTTFAYPSNYASSDDAIVNTIQTPLSKGVPKYLLPIDDAITASLLSFVNASFPESKQMQDTHPGYLSNSAISTLNVIAKSDVWITFVSEGAGNMNTLAYYTYKTGDAPADASEITNATIVLPNASANGSGGGLKPGNKVKLGNFEAGTSIGFILIGSGWTGKGVNTANTKFYSDSKLNPEGNASLRRHTVVLYDDLNKVTLVGFEDVNRQGTSDHDFNDLVFYASSNPVNGISNESVAVVDKGNDTDGDGVSDEFDAFPTDATKAVISYYPSATGYANIAFEDNWPKKGDFDLNDVVVRYRYTFVANGQNQVVSIKGDYNVTAVGASFKNGFGVEFPFAASAVQSVTGQKFKDSYIALAANGVEAGQSKAVIIPFDNTDIMITNPDNAFFVNVLNNKDKVTTSATASVLVTLATPVAQSSLTQATINPFLISNSRRGYEIHLPGYAPTNKADSKLFGTDEDNSIPASSRYYLATDNLPWAINYADNFIYPLEQVKITDAYLHFADWASSGGTLYPDWYTNTAAGYRALPNLYLK